MIASILREIKWYHVLGLVCGLVVILVLVLWLTRRENQPRLLPSSGNGDFI